MDVIRWICLALEPRVPSLSLAIAEARESAHEFRRPMYVLAHRGRFVVLGIACEGVSRVAYENGTVIDLTKECVFMKAVTVS